MKEYLCPQKVEILKTDTLVKSVLIEHSNLEKKNKKEDSSILLMVKMKERINGSEHSKIK